MKRTLRLKRETLGSLTDADLSGVVGGAFTREGGGLTCGGLLGCVDTYLSCGCIVTINHCVDTTRLPTCYCNTTPYC